MSVTRGVLTAWQLLSPAFLFLNHVVPPLVDRRQSKKLLEGENLASWLYVMNDFLYLQVEQELRFLLNLVRRLTKELNCQQVFLLEKGFATRKEVISMSPVS